MGVELLTELTERHAAQIAGVLGCYDRMLILGTLPGICYAGGMTSFLYARQVRIFDYPKFAEPFRERIRENAERMANEASIEIEFNNSCRNRHCPKCQAQARQRWLDSQQQELLGVPYFHVVFTLPQELNPLCERNPELLYDLLFRASADAMLEVAADPRHLGAHIGFLSILHTWGQNLSLHPHVHCVIPAGGFSLDRQSWIHPRYAFFLPVKVLSRVFRGKFLSRLKRAYKRKQLACSEFRLLVNQLFRKDWFVYAKPAFGGPEAVLRYLGRYTHRVAISNHRLVSFDGEHVTFRWKDYAHGNKQRVMTLHATEFLRRYVQHILPRGFVRIRHYGYLANACRADSITLARKLIGFTPSACAGACCDSRRDLEVSCLRWRDATGSDAGRSCAGTHASMQAARYLIVRGSSLVVGRLTCLRTPAPTCVCPGFSPQPGRSIGVLQAAHPFGWDFTGFQTASEHPFSTPCRGEQAENPR